MIENFLKLTLCERSIRTEFVRTNYIGDFAQKFSGVLEETISLFLMFLILDKWVFGLLRL